MFWSVTMPMTGCRQNNVKEIKVPNNSITLKFLKCACKLTNSSLDKIKSILFSHFLIIFVALNLDFIWWHFQWLTFTDASSIIFSIAIDIHGCFSSSIFFSTAIDMDRQSFSVLSPAPCPLPKQILVMLDLQFMDII